MADEAGVPESRLRPAWAEVDLGAVQHNARVLRTLVEPAALCAVVKADAYGHGAVPVARAAVDGGATWLAVATVEEGIELREAGIESPVLLLSEPPPTALAEAAAHDLTPTLYTESGVAAASHAARNNGTKFRVHVKVDTGMHRVGADADQAAALAFAVSEADSLIMEGLWTHLAVAEEVDDDFSTEQLKRFEELMGRLAGSGIAPPLVHAANSAGAIAHPAARYDMVRCGLAVYGYSSSPAVERALAASGHGPLRPAMSLKAHVSFVKHLALRQRISYGRRYELSADAVVATVPIGYADGVSWRLFGRGGQVLLDGRRVPIAGSVTMDQMMLDCGPGSPVRTGDEVVLLGRQGWEAIWADEWAERIGTITYEVLCGIGPRVPRQYLSSQGES